MARYMPHNDRSIEVYLDGAHLCTAHPADQQGAYRVHARAEAAASGAGRPSGLASCWPRSPEPDGIAGHHAGTRSAGAGDHAGDGRGQLVVALVTRTRRKESSAELSATRGRHSLTFHHPSTGTSDQPWLSFPSQGNCAARAPSSMEALEMPRHIELLRLTSVKTPAG
ncbi:hypothetical protein GCM10022419_108790 [Nonomuraea rosea]|uniref:Uncharacterized protein n=1 Tax=Nonomuraea rosea TaxID=638574 RepID=A0ABP6ZDK5_9ACTN